MRNVFCMTTIWINILRIYVAIKILPKRGQYILLQKKNLLQKPILRVSTTKGAIDAVGKKKPIKLKSM